jgi:hypothetical protein
VTDVLPLQTSKCQRKVEDMVVGRAHQLSPATVMGLQLKPTGTSRPVRSRPTIAATAAATAPVDGTTLLQHWLEVGGVTGGVVGVAAARDWMAGKFN